MSTRNLCNNGRCKQIRMGFERNHVHINERENSKDAYLINQSEETKELVHPDYAIKNIKKIIIGFVVIAAIAAFVVQIAVKEPNDFRNATTLAIEIVFGIFIALIVYIYTKQQYEENIRQQKRIENLVTDIQKIEENQQKIIDAQYGVVKNEKERIHNWKARWGLVIRANLESIKQHYIILEDWLKEYKKTPTVDLKSNIIFSAKRNGEIVTSHTQDILKYLPKIESYFDDPVLGLNIAHLCEQYPTLFYSMNNDYHWKNNDLENTIKTINKMKEFLDRDIKRLTSEMPSEEE